MNNEFFKKPAFIASCAILLSFIALSYSVSSVSAGGIMGLSVSFTGIKIAGEFEGIDILLWLIPLAAGFLIFAMAKPEHNLASANNVKIVKIVLLSASAFFWVRYMFLIGGSQEAGPIKVDVNNSAGVGMWLTLIAAIFVQFEEQIMAMVNKKK